MKKTLRKNNSNGITLIVLVITIIILLILSRVIIFTFTESNILYKSKQAGYQTEYMAAKEIIDLKLMDAFAKIEIENKDYNIEEITKCIQQAQEIRITKYYYIEDGVEILENLECISVVAREYEKYNFLIGKKGKIEAVLHGKIKDETKMEDFENKIKFEREQFGIKSDNKIAPNFAKIELDTDRTHIYVGANAKVTLLDNDNGSGIDVLNCKYIYNTESTAIGIDSNKYTGGNFSSSEQNIEIKPSSAGTYYLHVLTVNNAGNSVETISDVINIYENPYISYSEAKAYQTGGININSTIIGNYQINAKAWMCEKLNIPIKNCIVGKNYNLSFDLQVTNAKFMNQYAYSFQISNYIEQSNSSLNYRNAIPKNTNVNSFNVKFTAINEIMYINFSLSDLSDGNTYNILIPSSAVTVDK